jgi:hypothetical protein
MAGSYIEEVEKVRVKNHMAQKLLLEVWKEHRVPKVVNCRNGFGPGRSRSMGYVRDYLVYYGLIGEDGR